jgi:hypothetical protein
MKAFIEITIPNLLSNVELPQKKVKGFVLGLFSCSKLE